jgi:hypothetical protein
MAADSRFADPDDAPSALRPAWEETPDETDADRGLTPRRTASRAAGTDDLRDLLGPLCAATDALARLDARAAATDDPVREGLLARLAYLEAAGFLAHAHAWAHPLDLALRERGLTASTALAAAGAPDRALPQTFAAVVTPLAWAEPPFDELAQGDAAIAEALALRRALRRLTAMAGVTAVAELLQGLGSGALEGAGFACWWDSVVPPVRPRHRFAARGGQGAAPRLPPLLAAAHAAQSWMEAGPARAPTPAQALLLAAAVLARTGAIRAVVLPVWTAYPALGFGDRDALPGLRSDAAHRLVGWGVPVSFRLAFLHLVADSARLGLRELDRLEAVAEKGRGLAARADKRSRLPHVIDALLRAPVLTPIALAAALKMAPQTATTSLRDLQARGVVREVTGRGRFRAYAI